MGLAVLALDTQVMSMFGRPEKAIYVEDELPSRRSCRGRAQQSGSTVGTELVSGGTGTKLVRGQSIFIALDDAESVPGRGNPEVTLLGANAAAAFST